MRCGFKSFCLLYKMLIWSSGSSGMKAKKARVAVRMACHMHRMRRLIFECWQARATVCSMNAKAITCGKLLTVAMQQSGHLVERSPSAINRSGHAWMAPPARPPLQSAASSSKVSLSDQLRHQTGTTAIRLRPINSACHHFNSNSFYQPRQSEPFLCSIIG